MINALINGVMSLVMALVNILLTPIDLLITQFLPEVDGMLTMFNSFIDYILSYVPWAASWTFLNSEVLSIVVAYYTFVLTVPVLISSIKLAIKWYDKLKGPV